jgi:hypothetical protein
MRLAGRSRRSARAFSDVRDNGCVTQNDDHQDVRIRRVPKYGRFIALGGGLGAIITFVLTASFPVDPNVGFWPLFGYFALFGVSAGVVLGAGIALVLDRWASKRSKAAVAALETVRQAEPPADAPVADSAEGTPPVS